jgi:hypothetical protein
LKLVKKISQDNYPRHNHLSSEKLINEILERYQKKSIKLNDEGNLGATLLECILGHQDANKLNMLQANKCLSLSKFNESNREYGLTSELLEKKLIDVNNIKNFLNQTLLHFACDYNDIFLCKLLLSHGANCLLEDNYRQSPFILASKKKETLSILKLFADSIKVDSFCYKKDDIVHNSEALLHSSYEITRIRQIRRAAYYACCNNNVKIAAYLFESFHLKSEQLNDELSEAEAVQSSEDGSQMQRRKKISELNVLHVVSFKGFADMVDFLLAKADNLHEFINRPINEFRDSTALEEAFKGFISIDTYGCVNMHETACFCPTLKRVDYLKLKDETEAKKACYKRIVNNLVQNGAKFSRNFILYNDGLRKLLAQTFTGHKRDTDFVHFLYCCVYLFKFKLNELFFYDEYEEIAYKRIEFMLLAVNDYDNSVGNGTNKDKDDNATSNRASTEQNNICSINHINTSSDSNYKNDNNNGISRDEQASKIMNKIIEEFLLNVYLTSLRVIKDYKANCLRRYLELFMQLYYTGQLNLSLNKFNYLKERHNDIYSIIESTMREPMSLQSLCAVSIRNRISNFDINKVAQLNLPECLKSELFKFVIPAKSRLEVKSLYDYIP